MQGDKIDEDYIGQIAESLDRPLCFSLSCTGTNDLPVQTGVLVCPPQPQSKSLMSEPMKNSSKANPGEGKHIRRQSPLDLSAFAPSGTWPLLPGSMLKGGFVTPALPTNPHSQMLVALSRSKKGIPSLGARCVRTM